MPPRRLALDDLNRMAVDAFVAALGDVFEHSPWVAEAVAQSRPFATVGALHAAMAGAVRASPRERQMALLRLHPELGDKVARADLTASSQAEQGSLGLDRLSGKEFELFQRYNGAYRARYGFPFIICVRRHTRDSVLRQFERRLRNSVNDEVDAALDEIALIARLRLVGKVEGPGKPQIEGQLSTHVLNTTTGRPAPGVGIALYEAGAHARGLLMQTISNNDGRTDRPLIAGEPLRIGSYEIIFEVGRYFAARAHFFDEVIVRFSIAEPEGHYHVPLLLSPWSYTAYRGS